jgi:hypothetical protein
MIMFGLIKNMLKMDEGRAALDKRNVVQALEMAVMERNCDNVLDNAAMLRNQLRSSNASLSREDKVRVVRALNKAKVHALMQGSNESYTVFRNLDSISSDVVSLL